MKVLLLLSDGPGAPGGIARYGDSLLEALRCHPRTELLQVLVRRGDDRPAQAAGARVVIERHEGRVGFAAAAIGLALTRRFDLIICGHLNFATLAGLCARLASAPLWCLLYGIETWRPPGVLRHRVVKAADRLIAISRHTRRQVLDWAGVAGHRVRILAPTFDAGFRAAAAGTGAPPGGPVLLTVSRLDARERYKGHDAVMRCLGRLAERRPAIRYRIVGEGDDRPRLEALSRALGVSERVEFSGALDAGALRAAYREAHVFVMPSTGEGFGIVFLEALASGLAVVAANAGGAVDALRDGLLGELVDPHDDGDIVRGIEAALERAPRVPDIDCFRAPVFRRQLWAMVDQLPVAGGVS